MTVPTEALRAFIIEQASCKKAGKPLQSMLRAGSGKTSEGLGLSSLL